MASLANQTISSTYDGLIKTSSDNAVPVSGVQALEDGSGNALALSVGRSGNGVSVTGNLAVDSNILVGSNQSILAENNLRFKSTGASYIDHNTVGQSINFRVSSASSLDTTAMTISSNGSLAVDTNTLYVDAANNRVGVGESTPDYPLHISSTLGFPVIIERTNAADAGIRFKDSTTTDADQVRLGARGNDLQILTGGSESMRIDSSGNVGIGKVPSEKLDIEGASPFIRLSNTDETESGIVFVDSASAAQSAKITYDSGASNALIFYNNAVAERMRIDSSGNVGIKGNALLAAGLGYAGDTTSAGAGKIELYDTSTGALIIDGFGAGYLPNSGIQFKVAGSERMRIDSSGNVGIGTTTVGSFLGTAAGLTVDSGNAYSGIVFTDGATTGSLVQGYSTTYLYNQANGNFLFGTNNTERMRITSGGFLKASDTGTYLNATASYHELYNTIGGNQILQASSSATVNPYGIGMKFTAVSPNNTSLWFIRAEDSTTARFYVYSNGNVVNTNNSYGAISDAKLKENVVDASPKLDDLLQVKIRNFNYIGDDKKQLGVVAQELESVFPSMIDESPDFEEQEVIDEEGNVTKERVDLGTTTKSVKYSVFVPMLIKAIQELNAKVEQLESQLNA